MRLHLLTWPEAEAAIAASPVIVIPVGSTEQHGPTGLLGTDALCPEIIAHDASKRADAAGTPFLVGPTFNVGVAQHHMAFAGTITLRPQTMIAVARDWVDSLTRHGVRAIYWLNGHGGNVATLRAAFSEIWAARSLAPPAGGGARRGANEAAPRMTLMNWWDLKPVRALRAEIFADREGSHATPSEIAVTWAAYPDKARPGVVLDPPLAPRGAFSDAEDYRRRFPDGRIGSDPSLASVERGHRLIDAAARALLEDVAAFAAAD